MDEWNQIEHKANEALETSTKKIRLTIIEAAMGDD